VPLGVGRTQGKDEPRQRLILYSSPGHALQESIETAQRRYLRSQAAAKIDGRLDPNAAVPDRSGHYVDTKRFASAIKTDMLASAIINHHAPALRPTQERRSAVIVLVEAAHAEHARIDGRRPERRHLGA
jgi:hypothetical protein